MASSSEGGGCCKRTVDPLVYQALEEMEFERGIWSAALNGETDRVEYMLNKGLNPSKNDRFGYTALHYAARNGKIEVCRLLLKRGADVNAVTHGKATALHRAAHQGYADIIELLLAHGGNPFQLDSDGKSPLHKAAEQGHIDAAKKLLQGHSSLKCEADKNGKLPQDYVPPNHEELRKLLFVNPDTAK